MLLILEAIQKPKYLMRVMALKNKKERTEQGSMSLNLPGGQFGNH